jgi:hypothetical protein
MSRTERIARKFDFGAAAALVGNPIAGSQFFAVIPEWSELVGCAKSPCEAVQLDTAPGRFCARDWPL